MFERIGKLLGGKTDEATRRAGLASATAELEAELRRLGWWQDVPLEPERMRFRSAYGMDTMAFSQWLQYVFVPAARAVVAGERPLPPGSALAAHAVREFDGMDEAEALCAILRRVDDAVEGRV
jgi:uncharacterized protein YqcC (DUF446 family)